MKILNLLLPIMGLLTFILGCGGSNAEKPQSEWQKAKPISGAANLDHPQALAADDKFIYFVTGGTVASQQEGTNNVMKMPIGGGEPTILFKGGEAIPESSSIALDENYVYFEAGGLRRVPKAGGSAEVLSKSVSAWEIIVDNENIYFLPFTGEGSPVKPIYSLPKKGGEPKALTEPINRNGLCADDKFLYWTDADGVFKMSKTGGSIEKIYSTPNGEVSSDLQMDAENFYFLQGTSKKSLMRLPKAGGEAKQVAADVFMDFRIGGDEIVFRRGLGYDSKFGTNMYALFKVPKTGGTETELDRNGFVASLIVGTNKVFTSDLSKIYALDK